MTDPQPSTSCDLLITDAVVVTMDPHDQVFAPGAVAVRGRTILEVGEQADVLAQYHSTRTINAAGGVVHPGFVEAHTHVGIHLTRGAFPDTNHSAEYFPYYVRWFDELRPEDEHASTLLASLEMLRNGVTAFIDPGTIFEPDAAAEAVQAVGIRATLSDPFVWDVADFEWAVAFTRVASDTESALKRLGGQLWRNDDPDALVRGHVALYGLGSASDQLMVASKAMADEHNVVFSQHQSMEARDTQRDDARFGQHALVHLHELGVLGPNVTLAHLNYLRDDELSIVADSGLTIAWNPGNFLFYSVAADRSSPVPDLWARGANIALGTDTAKVWAYGEQGWLGYLVARQAGGFLPVTASLEMATRNGAQALGWREEIGTLEAGKRADIVIRSLDEPEAHPGLNPHHDIALLLRTKGVDTVLVDGRVVLRHGRSTLVDEHHVYEVARRSARSMVERVGLGRHP